MNKHDSPPSPGSFAAAGTVADNLHRAAGWMGLIQSDLYDEVIAIFGGDQNDSSTWACDDLSFDSYDNSLELKDCRENIELTPERAERILSLGFGCFWLNWDDGTDQFVTKESGVLHIGKRKRKGGMPVQAPPDAAPPQAPPP